jgi:hypothetical protein
MTKRKLSRTPTSSGWRTLHRQPARRISISVLPSANRKQRDHVDARSPLIRRPEIRSGGLRHPRRSRRGDSLTACRRKTRWEWTTLAHRDLISNSESDDDDSPRALPDAGSAPRADTVR